MLALEIPWDPCPNTISAPDGSTQYKVVAVRDKKKLAILHLDFAGVIPINTWRSYPGKQNYRV